MEDYTENVPIKTVKNTLLSNFNVDLYQMASKEIQLTSTVTESLADTRLDQALAELFPEYSRSRLAQWIRQDCVRVDGATLRPKDKVKGGELIEIRAVLDAQTDWKAQDMDLNVVYEDEDLIVINKPAGLVVHPAAGNPDKTLVNALLHHCSILENIPRAGIIHRIDKNTTGLLVVAKTLTAHHHLVSELQERHIHREYEAIVCGHIIAGGHVSAPIARHPKNRLKMAVVPNGKPATTHYRVIERFPDFTYLKVTLETGRTHQIRVHMTHIYHPIVGDPVYGGRLKLPKATDESLRETLQQFKRQALHAKRLQLIHPSTGKSIEWSADLPEDMQHLLEQLRR